MELAFDSTELRAICESEAIGKNHLGPEVAELLKHRLADLSSALSIRDLVVGSPRPMEGANEQMAIDVCDGYRIVFCANHPRNPVTDIGTLDWSKVSRVKILRIERSNV